MKGLGQSLSKFQALGVQILGISYDTPETQHRFAVHCAAEFPFLSDAGGKVAKAYHVAGGMGPVQFAKRVAFLIDREGKIHQVYEGMPDVERILQDARQLAGQP